MEEVRGVRERELEEVLALWQTVWPNSGPRYFPRYFYGDHDFQPEYTRVCVVDGRIAAAVHIVKRRVACGDFTLTMAGIANVATHPSYRNHGYGTSCLEQAQKVIRADAFDFGRLGTGIPGFYARLGWEPSPLAYLTGTPKAGVNLPVDAHVRPYEERDGEAVRALYDAFNRTRPFTVLRSPFYWQHWLGWHGAQAPPLTLVAESAGRVIGYSAARRQEGTLVVREAAAQLGAAGAITALLAAHVAEAPKGGYQRVEFRLPHAQEVRSAASELLADVQIERRDGSMVWFPDAEGLLRGLAPVLMERWIDAGKPAGRLRFCAPDGVIELKSGAAGLGIEHSNGDAALGQRELFDLLTGGEHPPLPPAAAALAAALFPRADRWYWEMDGF